MIQRLLLAIDDSPSSEVAVDFGTAFAKRCSASVHVLHVNEYLVGGVGTTLLTTAEATELVTKAVEQFHEAGVKASGSVAVAPYREVAARITKCAYGQQADAILLGSHRRQRLGRLFSSQIRERTIRLTSLPVFAAPSPLEVSVAGSPEMIALGDELDRYSKLPS
jgi:nucleotide-binding universal stress UspA family protein